jgi:antitoxin PrlF
MQEFETTLTEKGQVTIPQEIRRILGLHPKDKVRFEVNGEVVRIKQASSKLLQAFGAVKPMQKPEHFQEIRGKCEESIVREAVSEV